MRRRVASAEGASIEAPQGPREGVSPSPLGVVSGEGAVPPPQNIFGLFILVHSEVFYKLYIPIFACQFCDRKGDSLTKDISYNRPYASYM